MSRSNNKPKLSMIAAMLIFGTIGIFVSKIGLPSAVIAMFRSVIGTAFIGALLLIRRVKINTQALKRNLPLLLFSGAALGFNWIFLFESYRFAGVPVGTLCYYMAPVFVVLLSPFVLKERLTPVKLICSLAAIVGAALISGSKIGDGASLKGILFGLSAAALYCGIVIANKFIREQSPAETTFFQLAVSAAVMLPYCLLTQKVALAAFDASTILSVALVGVLHTGVAYMLYFGSVQRIPAQVSAVFSYIDPITSIILSALILNQPMTAVQAVGMFLILGATLFNELAPTLSQRRTAAQKKEDV